VEAVQNYTLEVLTDISQSDCRHHFYMRHVVPGYSFPVSLHGGADPFQCWESRGLEVLTTSFEQVFNIVPLLDFIFHLLMKNVLCHHSIRMNPCGMGREV